jgi:hypothetical protein
VSIGMHGLRQQKNCIHHKKAVKDLGLCAQNQQTIIKNISIIVHFQDNFAIIN